MASGVEELEAQARQLAGVAEGRPEGARAERLAERLRAGRFLVSVVGEFKRGKSTLINALVGADVLPTGVLPLTAVATELSFGAPAAIVEYLDGTRRAVDPADVADYVTEERNPGNERRVARVELRGRWSLLEPGVVLVDTPGVGSVHRHNTEAARAALLDADGTVLVLSADAPLSEQERDLLRVLADRHAPMFLVLNKADHLSAGELDQVRRFVEDLVCGELAGKARLFTVSARRALTARLVGEPTADGAGEFGGLVAHLERFIADDLVTARLVAARRELGRLGCSVRDGVTVEQAAAELDAATLAGQVERFGREAIAQRQAFDDDRTLLARDVARLLEELWRRLSVFAATAPAGHHASLARLSATAPKARLAEDLRAAVEAAVRIDFEEFRAAEAERTEQAWQRRAETFRAKTQDRVNTVREAAADLFRVPLPAVAVPPLGEEGERFFYLFVHVGSTGEPFGRLARRLLPDGVARRRALRRARVELADELDKHAGRLRWDVTQRLDAVRRRFEAAMSRELDEAINGIVGAAARAEELRAAAAEHRAAQGAVADNQLAVAAQLAALAEEPG